jgi:AraC-like DNA-binding protein
MGFTDEAHFSRLFRQAFGLSPRAARSAARLGQGPELRKIVPPEGASFAHWVTGLGAG